MTVAHPPAGSLEGVSRGEVTAYLGVPYARAGRFAAPEPVTWSGVRQARRPGPQAPQPPSRLERVMGPAPDLEQSEDCLSLNVWTPGGEGLPVFVWLHGGGFSSGSGGQPWYDGALLAGRGEMVVVTVNYRLGALGYLYLPDESGAPNAGLLDQLAALRWVRDNIAAFGGDPAHVTLGGQSAGALSALAMLALPEAGELFTRVALQSPPAGVAPFPVERAAGIGRTFLKTLGRDPREASAAEVVAAQVEVAGRLGLGITPPFQLVAAGGVSADLLTVCDRVELMIGTTRDEIRAFDENAPEELTDRLFRTGSMELIRTFPGAHAYRFDWSPEGSPFGACHCIDLPFLFGDLDAWRAAPMLAGGDPAEMESLVRAVQDAWIAFVRTGSPGWSPYPFVKHLGTRHSWW